MPTGKANFRPSDAVNRAGFRSPIRFLLLPLGLILLPEERIRPPGTSMSVRMKQR
jgi:hypothetical protein